MSPSRRPPALTPPLTNALCGVFCLTLIIGAAGARSRSRQLPIALPAPSAAQAQAPVLAQSPAQPQHIEVERITIRPAGFEPAEITRPAGQVLLAVNNSSGLDEVVLRLARANGAPLHEVRVPRRKRNWRKLVELPPGRFVLTEANHPDWICHITITH